MHELCSLRNMEVGASRVRKLTLKSVLERNLASFVLPKPRLHKSTVKWNRVKLSYYCEAGRLGSEQLCPRGVVAQKLTFLMTSCYTYNSLYNISYFKLLHYRGQLLRICFSETGNYGKGSGLIYCPLNSTLL